MTNPTDNATSSAAQLVEVVTPIPGVRGIEPGITSALKVFNARVRGDDDNARYGITIDHDAKTVIVEVGVTSQSPIRETVTRIQQAVLGELGQGDYTAEVRVKSLTPLPPTAQT